MSPATRHGLGEPTRRAYAQEAAFPQFSDLRESGWRKLARACHRGDMLGIRGDRLFDGVADHYLADPVVLVDQGAIVAVERLDNARRAVEVVDLGDVTLLPGLIDSHSHLVLDASDDPVGHITTSDDEVVLEHCRSAARAALQAGITTVRDLGDRGYLTLTLREELKADPSTGPELLVAGPPITPTGGHCWFLGGEADGVEGVRQAVRDHGARGVDLIKVMVTGGEITPGSVPYLSQYGPDELRAIAEEAHAHGLRVTGHAHGAQGVADAVAAGFDGIEHATFMTADGVRHDPDLFNDMAARRIFVSLPVASAAVQPSPPPGSSVAKRFTAILAGLQTMRAAGVAITVSSDAGIAETKPHDVLPHGVAQIARIGFSNADALRSVTSVAAESCGLGSRKGRIAPGYDADLLAVRGDPLTDPSDLRNVAAVFRAGEPIRRPALRERPLAYG